MSEQVDKLNAEIDRLVEENESAMTEVEEIMEELEEQQKIRDDLKSQINTLTENLEQSQTALNNMESQKDSLQENLQESREDLVQKQSELTTANDTVSRLNESNASKSEEIQRINAAAELAKIDSDKAVEDAETAMDLLRESGEEALRVAAATAAEKDTEIDSLKRAIAELKTKIDSFGNILSARTKISNASRLEKIRQRRDAAKQFLNKSSLKF